MNRYTNIFQSVPFIRISLWFTAGILCNELFSFSNITWLSILIFLFSAIIVLSFSLNYRVVVSFNILISISLFLFGAWFVRQNTFHFPNIPSEKIVYEGTILEKPVEKNKSYQTVIEISNSEKNIDGKVIAYFQKDEIIEQLKPGAQIIFCSNPNRIKNQGNPFEFDYQSYMQRQGITHSVYLKTSDFKMLGSTSYNMSVFAERCRDFLLSILRNHHVTGEEFSVVAALTLGHRKELNPETRDYFASSGAMHVLAVSGLHVGIIYLIFTFLLSPLKRKKYGRLVFTLLVGSLIWIYAVLAGLSPSVQRAAVMFSFILIGQNLNRPANIFNSLAGSAFLLMLFNPQIIFEVGFQLSYLAVTGIVLFQPLFCQLYVPKNRLVDKLWVLLTVSLAAQLSTFPLGLYYFSQFPNYFWLSNFIVIPAATFILGGTFLLFLISPIPVISDWIGMLIQKLTQLMLISLKGINSLPFALTDHISINSTQAILLLLIIASLYWFVKSKSISELRLLLVLAFGFFLASFIQNYGLLNQRKMIVYNAKSPVVQFVRGRDSYVLYKSNATNAEQLERLLKVSIIRMKLNEPSYIDISANPEFKNNDLVVSGNLICFSEKMIQISNNEKARFPSVDFRVFENLGSKTDRVPGLGEITIAVGDMRNPGNEKFNIYQTSVEGAFIADFKEN